MIIIKRFAVLFAVGVFLVTFNWSVNAKTKTKTINEADTELCETLRMAFINSNSKLIDKAISEIYKNDKNAPEGLTWASYDTEILKIKQLYGIGGLYEITLKVYPYYRAHLSYGEDEIVINTNGELINFRHLKTYP